MRGDQPLQLALGVEAVEAPTAPRTAHPEIPADGNAWPAETRQAWRLRGMKAGAAKGYWLPPGTGPNGERCRTCRHLMARKMGGTYYKCARERRRWTGGRASDICATAPACQGWEPTDGA